MIRKVWNCEGWFLDFGKVSRRGSAGGASADLQNRA